MPDQPDRSRSEVVMLMVVGAYARHRGEAEVVLDPDSFLRFVSGQDDVGRRRIRAATRAVADVLEAVDAEVLAPTVATWISDVRLLADLAVAVPVEAPVEDAEAALLVNGVIYLGMQIVWWSRQAWHAAIADGGTEAEAETAARDATMAAVTTYMLAIAEQSGPAPETSAAIVSTLCAVLKRSGALALEDLHAALDQLRGEGSSRPPGGFAAVMSVAAARGTARLEMLARRAVTLTRPRVSMAPARNGHHRNGRPGAWRPRARSDGGGQDGDGGGDGDAGDDDAPPSPRPEPTRPLFPPIVRRAETPDGRRHIEIQLERLRKWCDANGIPWPKGAWRPRRP